MKDVDQIAKMIERELTLNTFVANPVDTFLDSFEEANDEPRSPLLKLWDAATKHKEWKACMAAAVGEVSPPGWEGTVKAMKKHPEITNPWALSWWMDGQGMSSHKQSEMEGGPGSGRRAGGGSAISAYGRASGLRQATANQIAKQKAMRKRLGIPESEGGPGSGRKKGSGAQKRDEWGDEQPNALPGGQVIRGGKPYNPNASKDAYNRVVAQIAKRKNLGRRAGFDMLPPEF